MATVREDFEGSVLVSTGDFLFAGDEIPEGVEVGEHITGGPVALAKETPTAPAKTRRTRAKADSED